MESRDKLLFEISELVTKAFDKSISGEEFDRLQHLIGTDPKALECYFDIISTFSCLEGIKESDFRDTAIKQGDEFDLLEPAPAGSKVGDSSNVSLRGVDLKFFMPDHDQADGDDSENARTMLEILELERTSPTVVIENQQPQDPPRELIQKVVYPPLEKRKLTKFQKFQLAFAACIIGFMIYISYAPVPLPPPVVAELADSIDAVWDHDLELPDEYGYMVQSRYRLKKGYASILFNGGAKVTVEAPAELSLNSTGDMKLYSGKIYAVVPERAHGFTVIASDNKVVDLGTEFGIEVDTNNNTQLHVTKGKTLLYSGPKDGTKIMNNVDAGQARKIYDDGLVKDIPIADHSFVRKIDSNSGSVWKGEKEKILFAEYFDRVDHTVKTPLNHSPKWLYRNDVFVNYGGTLVKDIKNIASPSVVREFNPETNKVYIISLDVTNPTSGWIGLGFCRKDVGNYVRYRMSFDATGIGWMRYGNTTPAIAAYTGVDFSSLEKISAKLPDAGLKGPVAVRDAVHKTGPTTLMVKVDTTGNGEVFSVEYYQDNNKVAGPVDIPSKFFHYVGFSYKQTDVETENIDGILLDNFIIEVIE